MKTNKLFAVVCLLFLFSTIHVEGQSSETAEFNVFQVGISTRINSDVVIADNIDYEIDGFDFGTTNRFTYGTSIDVHVGYQKYGNSRNVFSLNGWFNTSKRNLYMIETKWELENESPFGIFSFDDNQVKIDDINRTVVGIEAAHYWRALRPKRERFFINLGAGIQTIYYSQDYFTFTQSTRTVNATKQNAIALNLITPVDINWRITEKIGIGLNIGINMFSKYFVLNNDLNLDPDNPLNNDFFRNPFNGAKGRLTASYFIGR